MPDEQGINYSELDDEWDVEERDGSYTSKILEDRGLQRLIFDEPFRDGMIEAEITIHDGKKHKEHAEAKVGALVFRFQDPGNYYYAGIGGHDSRFFIAKMVANQGQALATVGKIGSIKKAVAMRLQLTCFGSRITLSHNGVTQVTTSDDTFNAGPWGLHAWNSVAEFRKLSVKAVRPTCFVIMPFDEELDDVYRILQRTIEAHRFQCVRADERYLSGPIIEDIMDQIAKADLVVADFTGKNPNVFYEAGYAAALRKPVIQIAQSVSDLPFDVRHLRTFSYHTRMYGDQKLSQELGEAIRASTGFGAPLALANTETL